LFLVKRTVGWQALKNLELITPFSPWGPEEEMIGFSNILLSFLHRQDNPSGAMQQGDWSEDYYSDIFLCHSVKRLKFSEDKPVELV
jgi:hypothetical protein